MKNIGLLLIVLLVVAGCESDYVQDRISSELGVPVQINTSIDDCERQQLEAIEDQFFALRESERNSFKAKLKESIDTIVIAPTETSQNTTGDYTFLTLQIKGSYSAAPNKDVGTKSLVDQRITDGADPVNGVTKLDRTLSITMRVAHDGVNVRNFGTLNTDTFDQVDTLDEIDLALRDGDAYLIARKTNDTIHCGAQFPLGALLAN